jgi:acyl-CoA synthetase (AMP-forming)/AMP-acid ligase II
MQSTANTLPEALRNAARRFGDRLAYAEGSRRITWAELSQRVDDTATGLVGLGLQAGDRAAICSENSIDWITAYHAIVRAGGIPVLIYYELTRPEIEEQVRRPQCRVLFASAGVIEKLESGIEGVEHVIGIGGLSGDPRPSTGSGRTDWKVVFPGWVRGRRAR